MINDKADRPIVLVVGARAIGAWDGSVPAREGTRESVACRPDDQGIARGGDTIQSDYVADPIRRPERVRGVAAYGSGVESILLIITSMVEHEVRRADIKVAASA